MIAKQTDNNEKEEGHRKKKFPARKFHFYVTLDEEKCGNGCHGCMHIYIPSEYEGRIFHQAIRSGAHLWRTFTNIFTMVYSYGKQKGCGVRIFSSLTLIALLHLSTWTRVDGWSYNHSQTFMNWEKARQWCRVHYTDMVAIQNQEEIMHLNDYLPRQKPYYWIGIRKINDVWTWVGTNKTLTKEAENWAMGEPNNRKNNEDCVEIYIKRARDAGKWNDESCKKKKTALCYTASCKQDSCSGHGECVETINSHRCACFEGFFGEKCENVVACEAMESPNLGSCYHTFGNFSYNSTCQFTCENGYQLSDSRPLKCNASGNWSAEPPLCEAVQCSELVSSMPLSGPHDLQLQPSAEFSYGSTCTFSCADGFLLQGAESVQCTETGEWSADTPTCSAVQCSELVSSGNGSMDCVHPHGNFSYMSVCTFSCVKGHGLTASVSLTCGSSGQWSDSQPQCEAMRCPSLQMPLEGHMTCSSDSPAEFSYGSSCTFSCADGFHLQGAESVQCTETGEWSADTPTCSAVQCSELVSSVNGSMDCVHPHGNFSYIVQLNSSCTFSCADGFHLQGAESAQCTETGEWSAATPTCSAVQCSELVSSVNGSMDCVHPHGNFSYMSICTFSCVKGHGLTASVSLTCGSSGQWSDSQPQCEAISCQSPERNAHVVTECSHSSDSLRLNSSCTFSCADGFLLQGAESVQCTETGEWSADTPTCSAVKCPSLEKPSNGNLVCSYTFEFSSGYSYGSTCSFSCDEGVDLQGSETLTCNSSGTWTEEMPTCQAWPLLNPTSLGLAAAGVMGLTGLSMLMLLMKRLRQRAQQFDLNSSIDGDIPPQLYKNSIDSLI
ncbi:hypothetical protein AAFF_G00204070 [Aldrovandia affinis]|uniref:E-selectin n=1 Tax=Aldrovandia affinis TaxID=143900 RepID=A0AAD7W5G8_9TELE|nr:hypothetical protein AAFF_G00204070 [Aldrovandia affinis]